MRVSRVCLVIELSSHSAPWSWCWEQRSSALDRFPISVAGCHHVEERKSKKKSTREDFETAKLLSFRKRYHNYQEVAQFYSRAITLCTKNICLSIFTASGKSDEKLKAVSSRVYVSVLLYSSIFFPVCLCSAWSMSHVARIMTRASRTTNLPAFHFCLALPCKIATVAWQLFLCA